MKARIHHIRPFLPIIVFGIIVVIGLVYLSFVSNNKNVALTASGTIETTKVTLASEFGGLVSAVQVQEGDSVKAGQELVLFDDKYLQAQFAQAQSSLSQARAAYDQVVALAKLERLSAQKALDDLYENADIGRGEAENAVTTAQDNMNMALTSRLDASQAELAYAQARKDLKDRQKERDYLNYQRCKQSTTDTAYADYLLAKDKYDQLKDDWDAYFAWKAEDDITRATALSKLSAAKEALERAQANLTYCREKVDELDIAKKDAEVHLAEAKVIETRQLWESYHDTDSSINKSDAQINLATANLENAKRQLEKLKDGPDPDAVAIFQARLDSTDSGVSVAQEQVQVAEAAVTALKVQLDKQVIKAPNDGTVLARSVEPGEIVAPGAPLVSLAQLGRLTITVYLPEDRYGAVRLGDKAYVNVDSFPRETFTAQVILIADEAEFTPRNVQTAEGRSSTVFAIKLSVEDTQGRLKPGMPADVTFK